MDASDELRERYVRAVLRDVPAARRPTVEPEVRAAVTAAVVRHEADGDVGVRAALTELGDPVALARHYGAAPRYLIGPALYRPWMGVLRTALAVLFFWKTRKCHRDPWGTGGMFTPIAVRCEYRCYHSSQ